MGFFHDFAGIWMLTWHLDLQLLQFLQPFVKNKSSMLKPVNGTMPYEQLWQLWTSNDFEPSCHDGSHYEGQNLLVLNPFSPQKQHAHRNVVRKQALDSNQNLPGILHASSKYGQKKTPHWIGKSGQIAANTAGRISPMILMRELYDIQLGVSMNGGTPNWFTMMEYPIKMDDLEIPILRNRHLDKIEDLQIHGLAVVEILSWPQHGVTPGQIHISYCWLDSHWWYPFKIVGFAAPNLSGQKKRTP